MTNRFQRLALATTVTTYLLIAVGALVRVSGAGMGCPDWPRCFDRWVPPTELAQVPARFAHVFNVRLAWTEYLNRLLGVTTGLLIFATLVFALIDYRRAPRVVWSSFGAFVGVGLAGWLGKRVVEKNLDPAFVTVHMFVALAVVSLLVYATIAAASPDGRPRHEVGDARQRVGLASLGVAGALMVQIGLGTRVRAAIEHALLEAPGLPRGQWLARIGAVDMVHRTGSLVVLALIVGLAVHVHRKLDRAPALRAAAFGTAGLAVAQVLAGVGLAYAEMPRTLQVLHVTMASLLLGGLVAVALLAFRLPLAGSGAGDARGDAGATSRADAQAAA